ncbi:hypothetical protein BACIH_1355 [Bacillus amyloliquefaciens]|nr:hypothetical protein U471_13820 [Bacillus amyloliquefaciens CC178]QEY88313.1 hypothetical protein BACIT_0338 [Bacillus amyloliquefaciens]QEY93108.1 hypothetical protein BACIH_1355 [Bacillus amyloliquefaciens]
MYDEKRNHLEKRKRRVNPGGAYSPLQYVTGAGWQLVCFIIK